MMCGMKEQGTFCVAPGCFIKSQHGLHYVNLFQLVNDNAYHTSGELRDGDYLFGFVFASDDYKTARSIHWMPSFLTTVEFSMTAELTHGRFRIISLTEGNRPTSISRGRPGSQLVRLGESVDVVW